MPLRRYSDPVIVTKVWDAIKSANQAHHVADVAKIARYLQSKEECTLEQADTFIKQVLQDKLIIPNRKNTDPAHQTFKIVQQDLPELDGKDWYCFECHLAGNVIPCSKCFRVFHADCLNCAKRKFDAQKKDFNFSRRVDPKPKPNEAKSKLEDNTNPNIDLEKSNIQPVTLLSDDEVVPDLESESTKNIDTSLEPDSGFNNTEVIEDEQNNDAEKDIHEHNLSYDSTLCSVCNISKIDYNYGLEKSEVNYMLKFVLHRIRAWLPNTITHTMAQEDRPEWLTDSELTWRANQLFFEHQDMSVIEVKLNTDSYCTFSEFLADVYTVQHNVAIFHGLESQEYGAAELMVRDTVHDITEMKNCIDCYKHSNEKVNNRWFCLPCRVPHQLVWAKQKGYPYWPAKVIRETSTHYDVRFFGGKYERALLIKSLVKPITTSKESLQIKSSTSFTKAYEELKFHQLLLENPNEIEKFKASFKTKRNISSIKKNNLLTANLNVKYKTRKSRAFLELGENSHQDVEATKTNDKRKTASITLDKSKDKKQKTTADDEQNSSQAISGNVIDISDGEEEEDLAEYSFRENNTTQGSFELDETYEQVTSSTENFGKQISPRTELGMQPLDQPYSDSVEKMRRKLECLPNKKDIIKCAMDCMQTEIDKLTNDNNDHLKRLFESHNQQISETKKKQWCYNCEQDAIYHCCWNTAYCSQTCQQQHWQAEHKKVCRRKR